MTDTDQHVGFVELNRTECLHLPCPGQRVIGRILYTAGEYQPRNQSREPRRRVVLGGGRRSYLRVPTAAQCMGRRLGLAVPGEHTLLVAADTHDP